MKKNRSQKNFLIAAAGSVLVAIFLFLPVHSFAAELVTTEMTNFGQTSGLATVSLGILVARIIRIILGVSGIVMTCFIIYAGWLYATSQGEPLATKKAKDIIKTTIIGLLIVLSSFAIATYILNALLNAAGLGGGISTTVAQNFNEPLSGSLGTGIIESHYPARNATDIPRNTRIFVTFKERIKLDSVIEGYDSNGTATSGPLKITSVVIAPTDVADGSALASDDVTVYFTSDHKTFTFDPAELLGNSSSDTNYTVTLKSGIQKESGGSAFGSEDYAWTFEVSTEVDLTPPQVVSFVPRNGATNEAPNIITSITFNEAMDPVASSGTAPGFTNIQVKEGDAITAGTYSVSNAYRTVEFVPEEVCGTDPCGNNIYCLPKSADLAVVARAATVGADEPQAEIVGGSYNGLVDAAGNSLDGNKNGDADGPGESPDYDDHSWGFTTSAEENDDVPKISAVGPTVKEEQVGLDRVVTIAFNSRMQSSTLNSSNIKLIPDFTGQTFWYANSNVENPGSVADVIETPSTYSDNYTVASISHATFWESGVVGAAGAIGPTYYYYPEITNNVKSAWQICMSPANGPKELNAVSGSCGGTNGRYCCDGVASSAPCVTRNQTPLSQ